MENQGVPKIVIMGVAVIVLAIVVYTKMYTNIPAGHKGVMFYFTDGLDRETIYGEGAQLYLPWNEMRV